MRTCNSYVVERAPVHPVWPLNSPFIEFNQFMFTAHVAVVLALYAVHLCLQLRVLCAFTLNLRHQRLVMLQLGPVNIAVNNEHHWSGVFFPRWQHSRCCFGLARGCHTTLECHILILLNDKCLASSLPEVYNQQQPTSGIHSSVARYQGTIPGLVYWPYISHFLV